jgi:hypothetical protein
MIDIRKAKTKDERKTAADTLRQLLGKLEEQDPPAHTGSDITIQSGDYNGVTVDSLYRSSDPEKQAHVRKLAGYDSDGTFNRARFNEWRVQARALQLIVRECRKCGHAALPDTLLCSPCRRTLPFPQTNNK